MKKNPRFYLAILAARLTARLIQLTGGQGSHWPGKIALLICPKFLQVITRPKLIIGITGTNGKTTTANLLADSMKALGYDLAHNSYGSNLKEGVASALISASSFWGGPKIANLILELDERATRIIFPDLKPDYLLITNLFRESYSRNAHVEFVASVLEESIPPETVLIVNADDLISSRLSPENERYAFSISPLPEESEEEPGLIDDLPICPRCGGKLDFSFRRYHHIGQLKCLSCGLENIAADFVLTKEQDLLKVKYQGQTESYLSLGDTIQDDYNLLSALAVLKVLGHQEEEINSALRQIQLLASRKEIVERKGTTIYRMLAKGWNPIAVTRALHAVMKLEGSKALILLYNLSPGSRGFADNTAWHYDVDFELLNDPAVLQIVLAGARVEDFKLRLLFAGIKEEKIYLVEDSKKLAEAVKLEADKILILHELYSAPLAKKLQQDLVKRLEQRT